MFQRPAFREGSVLINNRAVGDDIGLFTTEKPKIILGDKTIRRTNFLKSDVRGRFVQFEGSKPTIELSDKTLEKLINIQVPDITDTEWLNERARRLARGESEQGLAQSLPLGRPQRTISKTTSLSNANNSIDARLETIRNSIAQGRILNTAEVVKLANTLLPVILSTRTTVNQMQQAAQLAQGLGIPKTWDKAGLAHRIWSHRQFIDDAGEIMLFLLSNIPPRSNSGDKFLVRFDDNALSRNPTTYVSYQSVVSELQNGNFLDVDRREIISYARALELTSQNGVDGGKLDSASSSTRPPSSPSSSPPSSPPSPPSPPTASPAQTRAKSKRKQPEGRRTRSPRMINLPP